MLRFVRWLKEKPKMDPNLTVEELRLAEIGVVRYIQQKAYHTEIQILKKGEDIPKSSRICSLEPFLDEDGLLKVKGRLQGAPIKASAKHPTIIPRECHVVKLIVHHVHEVQSRHSGREYVVAKLRRKFWIPQARVDL
jgi:hypothetical protein